MLRKLLPFLLLLLVIVVAAYFFRAPILNSVREFLIKEDTLQKADAIFVLSGNGYVRGTEAAKLYRQGFANKIICTGGNQFIELLVFGIDTLESDMTAANLRRLGVSDSVIIEIREGTSTREEEAVILNYCKQNSLKKIIVVSSLTHTRRINSVFREKFKKAGIELIIHGAPLLDKIEVPWWHDENRLIEVNNEWIKTFYYWWKY